MTKRELINALEASKLPDDTEVFKTHWESNDDATGWKCKDPIYSVVDGFKSFLVGTRGKRESRPVIML